MTNSEKLQRIMAVYCPVAFHDIDLSLPIKNRFVAEVFKKSFCKDVLKNWPKLKATNLVNNMFGTIKTGNDILQLIKNTSNEEL